jgi:Ca2+-dependent lipid-binding protein
MKVCPGDSRRARTSVKDKSFDPQWEETFNILVADEEESVSLTCAPSALHQDFIRY